MEIQPKVLHILQGIFILVLILHAIKERCKALSLNRDLNHPHLIQNAMYQA
jgi:hypothetical protein